MGNYNKRGTGVTITGFISCLLIVVGVTGYVKNIVKLTDCDFEAPYKCEVLHSVGLLPVVGVFTGYMDLGK